MEISSSNSVKILHCADFHIGAQNYYLRNKAKQRRSEVMITLERITDICRSENIEVMLISGDLFDSNHIDNASIKEVQNLLSKIPDTFVAICAGNHDYITSDSPYITSKWPSNVYIFGTSMEYVQVPKKDVRIWGCSFSTPYIENSLIKNVNVPNDSLLNIMVMHGEFVSENTPSKYNPITKMNLSYSGMDYVALGHIHHSSSVHQAGRTYFAYSGCPEGQDFEEIGLKGIYTGIVSKGHCNLTFRPVQYRMCITIQVDITGLRNENEIIQAVYEKMKHNYGNDYERNIYRVTFTGNLQGDSEIDFAKTEKELNETIFFVQVRNYTKPDIDLNEISSEMNLKGLFVKKMIEQIEMERDTVKRINLEKSLYLGLNAFDGEVNYYEN